MMLGATIGPVLSVPIRNVAGSWQGSLSSWALPAVAALVLWLPVIRRTNEREPRRASRAERLPWRARGAWLLALFMSAQSFLAYAYTAWLAPAYHARGLSAGATGLLLGLLHVAQLATTLVLPLMAVRLRDRRGVIVGAVAFTVAGSAWLFAAPGFSPWAATIVLGLGLGGGFSMGLVVMADYAADPASATRLAAMVFLVCYLVAAIAPVLVGALHDATGAFATPFGALIAVAVLELGLATRLGPGHRGSIR
jgi:CP family cyanate transporter-like MFS transporter